ncbi:MAG: hypothetical protein CME62_09200 [Halobacteriovoraceae bacterium]|nr:hypothetical protein [Halobacteriovoraceae bacterium]|tara:strand:- start:15860 stop:16480 length:621 start_codon:yes stop_codon:yes gene_type:complete
MSIKGNKKALQICIINVLFYYNMLLTYIILTYNRPDLLLKRMHEIKAANPLANIIVSDNSSPSIQELNEQNIKLNNRTHHLMNNSKCRFNGYNKALEFLNSSHKLVVFRTDDDEYDEIKFFQTIRFFDKSMNNPIAFSYFFNNQLQFPKTHKRPISSILFNYKQLRSAGKMNNSPASDWKYIAKVFEKNPPLFFDSPYLNKLPHTI